MDTSQPFVFRRMVSLSTFNKLCCLVQQMASDIGKEAILLTEETVSPGKRSYHQKTENRFRLLFSPKLSLLLLGQSDTSSSLYQISLTWEIQKIHDFLTKLGIKDKFSHCLPKEIPHLMNKYQSLNYDILNQFILNFLQIITLDFPEIFDANDQYYSVCYPTHQSLYQQLEQERLLNQVITQIRQSLELPVVLETAVKEGRNFLQVDRLLIYQFIPTIGKHQRKSALSSGIGRVTYEAISSVAVPSLLDLVPEEDCFYYVSQYQKKFRHGTIVAIDDVEVTYSSSFCLVDFLRKNSVRSTIIAPIVVKKQLWGLVIAHQCFKKRRWQKKEQDFLGKIGEHLAIAIQQAELYSQVKEQKNNFEKRVIERTQQLYDTLLAAQTANQYKTEFIANISHELLTPLTCIIGLSGTLLHWAGKESSLSAEKQAKYIKNIQDNGKKLLKLIHDILDYSSLQSGNNDLNLKDFSLYTISSTLIEYFQEEAEQKEIKLSLDFQVEKDKDKFCADSRRVQQIISQLIKNAIKFTLEQGKVVLRVWRENDQVFFQVEDTGIGISEEELPLLFENFQQLEKSRNRTHGGTGLGLALTKQLVELHRGTIEVESIPKYGSVFTVRLPNQVKNPLNKDRRLGNYGQDDNLNRTIVIISRDEENSIFLCELLTINNYQVIWLIDDYPPLKQLEVLQPKILIIDQDKNSQIYTLTKQLKQNQTTEGIKILILKTSLQSMHWPFLVENGIDDYLIKPLEPNQLLQKIQLLHSL